MLTGNCAAWGRTDNINLPFRNDPAVLGSWKSVAYVRSISHFVPGRPPQADLFFRGIVFLPNGKTPASGYSWTRGVVIDANDRTAESYVIKKIGGLEYLFLQWKNGDYILHNRKPEYYVLVRAPDVAKISKMSGDPLNSGRNPIVLSKTDPYSACPYEGPGTLQRGTASEPSLAEGGPPGKRLMMALWEQDYIKRPDDNGAIGYVAASSRDSGRSWTEHAVPYGNCAGHPGDSLGNARVAIGPDGTAYIVGLASDGKSDIHLWLISSSNGGDSWTKARTEVIDPEDHCHSDEPSITANPVRAGWAYAAWTEVCFPGGKPQSDLWMTATSDFGRTWEGPRRIAVGGSDQTNWPIIAVHPDSPSTLSLFFSRCRNYTHSGYSINVATSSDSGLTWAASAVIARGSGNWGPRPSAAIAPDGAVYVAWDKPSASRKILLARLPSKGRRWSKPRVAGRAHNDRPSLAITSKGLIAIFTRMSVEKSLDGGKTFSKPASLGYLSPPNGFAGDYIISAVSDGSHLHAVFECAIAGRNSVCFR